MWPFNKPKKPECLIFDYEPDANGDNHEWRDCYSIIKEKICDIGSFSEIEVPDFIPDEDFVTILTLVDGVRVAFYSDRWLGLLVAEIEQPGPESKEALETMLKIGFRAW